MIDAPALALIAAGYLLFGLVKRSLANTPLTGPMLFSAFGLAIGSAGFGLVAFDVVEAGFLHALAEITLVLVLFTDAARIDFRQLLRDHDLPVRMLMIGLPLCVVLGAFIAKLLFPAFSFWELVLLAAILAPTDAALGQAVVSSTAVPVRIRQALNMESGLNDGIALPLVLLAAMLAAAAGADVDAGYWTAFVAKQILLGPLAGIAVGLISGRMVRWISTSGRVSDAAEGIIALAVAMLCFAAAESIEGNGFIAAFVGGMTFGTTLGRRCDFLYEFAETEGQILTLTTFLVFGGALLGQAISSINATVVLYAVLSLSVIRMLPVSISLSGTGLSLASHAFLGWFGPRGLASVLFVLVILEDSALAHRHELLAITVVTVGLSIVLHGVTAAPASRVYGRVVARRGECEERKPVPAVPYST